MTPRKILRFLVVLAVVSSALAPAALGNNANPRAHAAQEGPIQSQKPDMSGDDDDGATVGVQVNPTAGTQRIVQVQVRIDDDNGHNDVRWVNVTVYQPDNATVHVAESTASKSNGNGRRAVFTYTFQMQFYDPAGTYHVKAVATDRDGLAATSWSDFAYQELAALSTSTTSVSLNPNGSSTGSVSPGGDTHASPSTVTITNDGNVKVDLSASGTDLSNASLSQSIGIGNVHYSFWSDLSNETALTSTATTNTTFDLAPGASSSKDVYLALHVPQVSAGTYTGTVTLQAVKG